MSRPQLIHCSYHKCLTVYFKRVLHALCNRCRPWGKGYQHFNSHLDDFYAALGSYRVMSVNNRSLDLSRLDEFRITRFVRDPRDLVVSGYHYHRRGAEDWVNASAPSEEDWYFANGTIPAGLREHGGSYASYLQSLSEEDGLLAELEFRQLHFESMRAWPTDHPNILTQRYEDIAADQPAAIARILEFYGLGKLERALGGYFARRYSARRSAKDPHVRDPSAGQWRRAFTPRVRDAFDARHPGLAEALGYPGA